MLTPLCVIATLAFKAHYVIVRTGSLGVKSFFASPFALESRGVERLFTSTSVLGSLGVKSCLLYVKLNSSNAYGNSTIRASSCPLGGLLGSPEDLLEPSWGPLGGLLGLSWAVWGPSWAVLGPSWAVLEPFWAVLGPFWGPLGPSWGGLEGLWGRLGTIFGASWAVLGRSWPEKRRSLKTFKNLKKINVFGLIRPSRGSS